MTALPQQTQHQIYQQIPAHLAALAPNGHHAHSIYQPLVAVSQGSIYVSNMATLRRPQIPMHQQLQPVQQQPLPPAHALQMKSPQAVAHESNLAATTAETSLYDRDKQIYKCSTLRQGGKFDAKYKPSILNCPLPEIPKDAEAPKVESIYERKQQQQQQNYSKTLQRMPMKIPPQIKAIPPPRIGNSTTTAITAATTTTTPASNQSATQAHNGLPTTATTTTTAASTVSNEALPPPPTAATLNNMENKAGNILNNNSTHNNSNNLNNTGMSMLNGNSTNGRPMEEEEEDLPPPPPPALNDDSNYAVTEL